MFLTSGQHYKFAAIQWRNDHLEHCDPTCKVCLSDLLRMAQNSGAVFTDEELGEFIGTRPMRFTS